jgi:hypothetical protein
MRWQFLTVLWALVAESGIPDVLAAAEPTPLAGWYGVVPELTGYARTFKAPQVKGKNTVYQQAAHYEWTGGALKSLDVTLSRDPAFAESLTPEALAKQMPAPKEVMVGKKTAWLTVLGPEGLKQTHKLVIPLGTEKALILEGKAQLGEAELLTIAGKFDLAAVEKALDQPPRTDFGRSLEAFRGIKKGDSFSAVMSWVGNADGDIGSGIHILEYKLKDGSRVLLGTPDLKAVMYLKHEKDGKTTDLAK